MSSYIAPERREEWWMGPDGLLTTEKRYKDKKQYVLNYSRWLPSGRTIDTVTWESDGVTISGESNTTTTVTFTVLYSGTATATITLDNGESFEEKRRFLSTDNSGGDDYGR